MSGAPRKMAKPGGTKRRIRRGSVNDNDREFRAAAQAGLSESEGSDEEAAAEHLTLDAACRACAHLGPAAKMRERAVLYTRDEVIPPEHSACSMGGGTVRIFKGTYAANDPNEDRNTLAVGDDFIFAGVWDGHGGVGASIFAESAIYEQFKAAKERGMDTESAFTFAYGETDRRYLEQAREQARTVVGRPADLFAGTCALGTYVDFRTGMIHVGNLGDSRAVFGAASADGSHVDVIPLSWDHACEHAGERERVCSEHPAERPYDVIINCGGDDGYPDDYRVKGVCSFTRSIGDFQMKDKEAAATYNSHTQGYKVVPRPGVVPAGQASINKPYIINEPTFAAQAMQDGFLIVACDGVWDELSNEQAVQIVGKLLKENPEAGAPIAELFIDKVLQYAVKRIKSEIPEEKHITLEKMKARPVGKADYTSRSCLHDDITAVIVQFSGVGGLGVQVPEAETPLSAHSGVGASADEATLKAENAQLRTHVEHLQQRVQQLEFELTEARRAAASGGAVLAHVDDESSDV